MRMCNRFSLLSEKLPSLAGREPFGPSVAGQAVFTRPTHRFTYSLVPANLPRIPRRREKKASPDCQGEFLRK